MNLSEKIRTGLTAGEIKQAFRDKLCCGMGQLEATATKHDLYFALALTVRDRQAHRRESTSSNSSTPSAKIREEVGAENFFLFGLTAAEVGEAKSHGYRPRDDYEQSATLPDIIDFLASGALGRGDVELFRPLVENLVDHDPFLLLADYQSYIDAQERVGVLWRNPQAWTRQSILNTARMGKFSSDRSIRDYCERVWKVQPASVAG